MKILVLNSGSSSQKASLYDFTDPLPPSPTAALWDGQVEWQGDRVVLQTRNSTGAILNQATNLAPRPEATVRLLDALTRGQARVLSSLSELDVVGHRIVNGGQELTQPTAITREVKTAIRSMSPLAPLHNRAELDGIEIIEKRMGDVLQVAVFDTGFHSGLPEAAAVYPGPYEWLRQGIRRYGFHGINHQYCAERAAQLLGKDPAALKLVTCHLGNGCSLAAIQGGRSVDTTMGFTPLEGLMMGTRSGSVDPGILTYLLRQGHTGQDLDEILNAKSGLLGISGLSADMRMVVSAMQEGNARAKLAFEVFIHRLRSGIAAMAATLSGMDALVFTAGIGENSAEVRAAACSNFAFLGLAIDPAKNLTSGSDRDIATTHSAIRVLVIRAQEDWAIARECWKLSLAAKAATQKHYNGP
jgi:acetate kinase